MKDPIDTKRDTPVTWTQGVTPALAKAWLASNTNNRNLNPSRVKDYASAMRAGDWGFTHQGIAFDSQGVLVDGQHRLAAIVESGVTLMMQITMGLAPDARLVVDTGRARSAAQTAGLMGVPYAKKVTAWSNVIRALILNSEARPIPATLVQRVSAENTAAIEFGHSFGDGVVRHGPVGAALLLAYPANPAKVEAFFKHFLDGANLDRGTGVFVARKYYFESAKRDSDSRADMANKMLRCIIAHIEGETLNNSSLMASEVSLNYCDKHHPPTTVFGEFFLARRIKQGKGGKG